VHEGSRTIDAADNVGHTGLVSTEGSEVRGIRSTVLGERSDATSVLLGTLLGEKSQVTPARSFELSVRPVRR
jgi:hypothetical protein